MWLAVSMLGLGSRLLDHLEVEEVVRDEAKAEEASTGQ